MLFNSFHFPKQCLLQTKIFDVLENENTYNTFILVSRVECRSENYDTDLVLVSLKSISTLMSILLRVLFLFFFVDTKNVNFLSFSTNIQFSIKIRM
jgi:hypothetical protein